LGEIKEEIVLQKGLLGTTKFTKFHESLEVTLLPIEDLDVHRPREKNRIPYPLIVGQQPERKREKEPLFSVFTSPGKGRGTEGTDPQHSLVQSRNREVTSFGQTEECILRIGVVFFFRGEKKKYGVVRFA